MLRMSVRIKIYLLFGFVGSVAAALIVGFVVYILTIILREVWRQWNLRRIFSGLPEPGKRHWQVLSHALLNRSTYIKRHATLYMHIR
jgi:hypothetical protein